MAKLISKIRVMGPIKFSEGDAESKINTAIRRVNEDSEFIASVKFYNSGRPDEFYMLIECLDQNISGVNLLK